MSAKDAGDAGDVVHYGHPPKNTRFLTPRGDAQKAAKNRLNKSANPSPLIRVGPAWRSAKVRRWVGGMGRTALYLKVGPTGLGLRPYHGPQGLKPSVAGFKRFATARPLGWANLAENVKNGSLGVPPLWWSHPFCPEKCMNMSETPLAVRLLSAHVCVFTRGRGRWSVSNASPATGAFSPAGPTFRYRASAPRAFSRPCT